MNVQLRIVHCDRPVQATVKKAVSSKTFSVRTTFAYRWTYCSTSTFFSLICIILCMIDIFIHKAVHDHAFTLLARQQLGSNDV